MKTASYLPEIDVFIPVAEKDAQNSALCISNLKKYCANPIRQITVVGAGKLKDQIPDDPIVRWVDEEMITPGLADIEAELQVTGYAYASARWYFQQLLKLYAFRIVNPSTDYILVHDADVAFVQEMVFVDEKQHVLMAYGYPFRWELHTREHTIPEKHMAINTAQTFLPDWTLKDAYSGMQHHMLFERDILSELFGRVEHHHQKEFWRAFIHSIDRNRWHGISEYVIYRHFAITTFPQKVHSRHVNGIDVMTSVADDTKCSLRQVLGGRYPKDVMMLGCHQLTDYKRSLKASDYIPEALRKDLLRHLTPLALYLDAGLFRIQPVPVSSTADPIMLFVE